MDVGGGILYCWSCASHAMGRVHWGPRAAGPSVVQVILQCSEVTAGGTLQSFLMLRVSEQAVSTGWLTFTGQTTEAMKTNNPKHLRPPLVIESLLHLATGIKTGLCCIYLLGTLNISVRTEVLDTTSRCGGRKPLPAAVRGRHTLTKHLLVQVSMRTASLLVYDIPAQGGWQTEVG